MAARRAAARAAAAEPPPPPAPEPTPEPEPEPKEPEKPPEKPSLKEDENLKESKMSESFGKDGKVTERIIERIIICPGGQNPYMPSPPPGPPPGHCHCPPQTVASKKKRRKGKKKGGDGEDEPCRHPFCVVQRARAKPQGLPWASGLYKYQQLEHEAAPSPPVVICQRPVLCCCRQCSPSDSSDSEPEDPVRTDTEQYMTFMNMVFAAANVINERSDVY